MSTVAKLSASVEANTDNFSQGMKRAKDDLGNFTNSVSATSGNIQRFESAMGRAELSSRQFGHAAGILGTSLGGSGTMIGDAARSFLLMGPAIGGVVAGFILYNKIQEESQAKLKRTLELNKEFNSVLKETNQLTGQTRVAGAYESDIDKQQDKLIETRDKLQAEGKISQAGKIQMEIVNFEKLKYQFRELDEAKRNFEIEDHNNKMTTKPGNDNQDDRELGHIKALQTYADKLQMRLSSLPEQGKYYNQVLDQQLAITEQIQAAEEALAAKGQALSKRREENELRVQEHMREEYEKSQKASTEFFTKQIEMAKKFEEEAKTPIEHFYDEVTKLFDAFDSGGISAQNLDRLILKSFNDLQMSENKALKAAENQGSVTQIDLADINPLFQSGKKQEINVPELQETNKQISDIRQIIMNKTLPARTTP